MCSGHTESECTFGVTARAVLHLRAVYVSQVKKLKSQDLWKLKVDWLADQVEFRIIAYVAHSESSGRIGTDRTNRGVRVYDGPHAHMTRICECMKAMAYNTQNPVMDIHENLELKMHCEAWLMDVS